METLTYDEQNKTVGKDVVGTIVTDGSSPKHNNRVIDAKGGGYADVSAVVVMAAHRIFSRL